MAVFPSQVFTGEGVPTSFRSAYSSLELGRKFLGFPKGVYVGFTPSAVGSILTLDPDPTEGFSLIKVLSSGDLVGMDLVTTDQINLDLSTISNGSFPVEVIARADYTTTSETVGEVFTRTVLSESAVSIYVVGGVPEAVDLSTLTLPTAPVRPGTFLLSLTVDGFGIEIVIDDGEGNLVFTNGLSTPGTINYQTGALTGTTNPLSASSSALVTYEHGVSLDECLICVVDGPNTAITVRFDDTLITPERDVPLAHRSVRYGFMPAGAVETLDAAVDVVNDVIAARVDLLGVTQASLSARLASDLTGASIAGRLSNALRVVVSNIVSVSSGSITANISSSFSAVSRNRPPFATILGGGTETQAGAITGPTDNVRNVAVLVDTGTGGRLIDNDTDRRVVFGRVSGPDEAALDGTLTFTNAQLTVTGLDTEFTGQLQVNDLVVGPDGLPYAVALIVDDENLVLQDAFLGTTTTSGGLVRRRFTLTFFTLQSGAEQPYSLVADTDIQAFFPVWFTLENSNYDGSLFMHAPGERPPLQDATTSVPGRVRLADAGVVVGEIKVQNNGTPLPGGPFHTFNFVDGGGQVVETATGEVTVGEIGPPGADGNPGASGGPGVIGDTGPGFSEITTFEPSGNIVSIFVPGGTTWTHDPDMGHAIRCLSGGIARWQDDGFHATGNDVLEIDTLEVNGPVGSSGAIIEGTLPATADTRSLIVFLSSAGD